MKLQTTLLGKTYQFRDVKEVLAKANELKSGDQLAGIAAATAQERVAAKVVLANMLVSDVQENPAVPYETDEVTRVIMDDINQPIYESVRNWTMADLREYILDTDTTSEDLRRLSRGLSSEVVAGVAKLMSNLDLITGAKKAVVTAHCNTTIGLPGSFATRLQPNHPTDDLDGILASVMEGLSYGCGDAVIGLNPVDDSQANVERILHMFHDFTQKWKVPTQSCVLAHVTTQMAAVQAGAPSDLIFQSIAGSQKGNEAFG
ncbi:MAG: ethanolamine ammonia-lyase subunit EutB, partial [Propionibacteriaceae bacterium]|nr:ethanolamine ammonia-lyase subunit EutB [Propionibacteriaceae bacterium]